MDKLFELFISHPWKVIIATLTICLAAWAGLDGIVERSDYKAFVDADYPGMVELEEVEDLFNENNNVFIAIAPDNGKVFTAETMRVVQELTEAAWKLPYAQRVDSLTNYQHTEVDRDDLIVNDLVPANQPIDEATLKRAEDVAMDEPSLRGLFISEDKAVTSVNIIFQFQYKKLLSVELAESGKALYEMLEDFESRYPDIKFYAAGSIVIDYVSDVYHAQVSHVLVPMMLLIMGILLIVTLRSFWGTLSTSMIVVLTGATTMGLFGWLHLEVDGVTAIAPIVIMTLAVADSVHINAGVLNGMRDGKDKRQAILYSLKLNITPVFLTSLTTVLGIITFSFTDFPSLKKLGMIIALGVSVAFVLSITLLPALLAIFPLKAPSAKNPDSHFFRLLGEWVIRHYRKILPLSVLVCLGFAMLIPRTIINESIVKIFDSSTQASQAIEFIANNLSGSQIIDVAVLTDQPDALNDPELLETLEEFSNWAKAQPEIKHVTTITDTFKRLNRNMHQDDPAWYKLPGEKALAAQYLLLYEMSLPYGLDLNNQLNLDKSGTRLTLMTENITSGESVDLQNRITGWFNSHSPGSRNIATGMMPLMAEISVLHMLPNMLAGGLIAIFTVSLVLFFALRSWKFGLLGLMANVIPIAVGYGIWAISHGMVNFAVASVAGICLGVVVDFAIHFLNKFQQGASLSGTTEDAIRYTFEKVAAPLTITMVVLTSGFWVLTFSDFNLISDMGLLTGLIIVISLLFNLFTLPSLLLFIQSLKARGAVKLSSLS